MSAAVPAPFRARVEQLLRVDPEVKPKVYAQVSESAEITSLNYWLELILAAGIATLGLVLNSPAVIIGAMLISPLMGPIIAVGLALATADLYLGLRSVISVAASIVGSVLFSALLVAALPFHTPTAEVLSRTQPNLLDLGVAILTGFAGSIVVARGGGAGGVTALPGVAIAVSLMPPLCAVGFGLGAERNTAIMYGAGLLFLANLAAIVASAFVVFLVIRMDAPDVRAQISQGILARAEHDRLYSTLRRMALARPMGSIGKLRWRVAMLVAIMAVLFVPLREAFARVRAETVARGAVRDAVRRVVPANALLTQQMQSSGDRIRVALVVTESAPRERILEAERLIAQRTGRPAEISVRKVAGENELALLRAELLAPPPAAAEDLEAVREELLPRLAKPLNEVWPASQAYLSGYELGFENAGIVIRIRYRADVSLDAATESVLTRALMAALEVNNLRLVLENETPPPAKKGQRK
ncbi:MAG TPA: DUF389 domain-containing protein [Bryobacteraceae bacterium]|nr:DUF389 domain-containing protein [Bryobacteraceae bacterium]